MKRREMRLALVAIALIATALVLPVSAGAAYTTNAECLTCHTSVLAQNFTVGDVNRDTACQKCHTDGLVGSHPYHNANGNCGATCHPGWGGALGSNVPSVVTTGGAFATATSQDTPAALLHIIHSKARWESSIIKNGTDCGACHAVAACTACHENTPAPDTTHADHGSTSTTITPWVGDVSYGSAIGKVASASIRCGAVGCHDTNKVATNSASLREDHTFGTYPDDGYTEPTVVTIAGTWTYKYAIAYTAGMERVSNYTSASLSTTFNGERVVLVSDKDPYRGIAQIYIDGTPVDTVDLYRATTKYQVPVWTSPTLAAGTHTIMIKPTGTKNASARAAFVSVDQFKVYGATPGSISPLCTSCHPANANDHGSATSFPHDATQTAGNLFDGGTGGYRCDSCHSTAFFTEHGRTSSSSKGKSCSLCHTTYAPYSSTGTWNSADGCNYQQCHATATSRQPHASIATSHTVPTDASLQPCRDCHAGDLAVIHNNSITTNAYTTTCNTCHTPSKFPTTNNCADTAGCHTASAISIVDDHPQNATFTSRHTPSSMTSTTQSPGPDGAIYTATKNCSACHSAKLTTAHATTSAGTISCTSGGTGNTGCHFNTSLNSMSVAKTGWTTEKCAECHDYGTAKTHDTATTTHVVPAGTCAGSGASCHNYTDLAALHAVNQAGGTAKYASCTNNDAGDPTGCHSTLDKRPARWASDTTSCGQGTSGCHTDKSATNHGKKHLLDLAGSNYANATQSGCTNSGSGCHGSAVSTDIADYHPTGAVTCLSSGCHTSVDKPTHHEPFVCTDCHDSTYTGALDTTGLADAYPLGHYSEPTHTVDSMTTTISAGGTYSAACSACHNPTNLTGVDGLYYQHQGLQTLGATTCSDCHNANASIQTIVTDTTRTNTCAACHTASVLPTMTQHGSTPAAVAGTEYSGGVATPGACVKSGCHATTDLHALHKSNTNAVENNCTMSSCHDSTKQGWKPTVKTCGVGGTCHNGDPHNPAAHITLASSECVVCHESTDLQVVHSNNCSLCHGNPSYPTLPTGKLECTSCHTPGTVGTKTYTPVEPSHYDGTETSHTASSAQSSTVDADNEGYSCGFCHKMEMKPEHITKTSSAFTTATAAIDKCIVCHENNVDGLGTYPAWNKTCTSCHAVKHADRAAKHDATSVGAGCAGSGASTAATLSAENFDSVTAPAWPSSWTKGGTNTAQLVTSSSDASSTPNSAQFASDAASAKSAYFQQTFDTSALTSPQISFAYKTAFPGSSSSETMYPAGAGTTTGVWDTMPATWSTALDTNDGDTTYVGTATRNEVQDVDFDSHVTGSGTISNVTIYMLARSAGDDSITMQVKSGTSLATGTSTGSLGATYAQYSTSSATDPATGAAWTWAAVDALQLEMTSARVGATMSAVYVTQAWVVVDYAVPASSATNYLKAQYSTNGGSTWTDMLNTSTATGWTTVSSALPQSAAVLVRFSAASDATNRIVNVDDIALTYQQPASTCHNVADVAAIHNNSAAAVTTADTLKCAVCHKNNDAVPTVLTCNASGCHDGATHVAVHISSRVECTSCHGSNNVQIIHAGVGDGCNVCHGGGGYTNVATGKTADCVDCHNASGVGVKKTYSPITTGHYAGTETSHTAGATQGSTTLNWAGNPTCAACHGMELYPEHNRVTASKTTTSTNTCENCHLSTVFTNASTVVAGQWADRNTASACIACHAVDTATNQHGQTAITGNHAVTGDTQSCASSGAGCHPVSNVAQVGTPSTTANIHTACASCHGTASRAGLVTPGALAQGCTGNTNCHATGYATNNHNALTGNETIHTASAASMATTVGAYVYKTSCTDCHSSTLALAHKETSTTAVLDSGNTGWNSTAQSICRDCHNAAATAKTVASSGVVKGNWSTGTCAECHTASPHSSYANHSVTAASGCTLSAGCHGYTGSTLDVRAIHDKASSGCTAKGTDGKGWSGGCHELDKAMSTTAMSCGSGATGQACHTNHTNTNHGPDHAYTTASDYTQTADTAGSEAGCSNSGTGCHGTSGALRDAVTDYHPAGAVSCLSSACHTSSTMTTAWKTGGTGADCSRCHNNNFVNAKTVMPLYAAASAGHYSETTHTAGGMTTTVSAGGSTTAACSVCHSTTLRDAHGAVGGPLVTTTKGAYVTCQECHGYNAAVSAVVTDTVHANTCATCHTSGVMGASHVVHSTTAPVATVGTGTGCASTGIGCHTTGDLHDLHKNAGSCALSGCHDAVNKSLTASTTSCGQATGCHTSTNYTSTKHNGTHGLIVGTDTTHTAGTTQMNDTYTYNTKSAACSACHSAVLLAEHSRSTSTLSGAGTTVCLQCHNDSTTVANVIVGNWINKNTTSACSSCHANTDATSAATLHGNVTTAHTATAVTGCTGLGAGCHGTSTTPDLSTVHTTGCALTRACHSPTVYNPGQKSCISATCHTSANFSTSTYAHDITTSNINGVDATHTATSGMTTTVGAGGTATAACTVCHSSTLKAAHDITKATASLTWTNECTNCHNATSPVTVATIANAASWTHACTGNGCHNTTQDVHVAGGAATAPVTLGTTTVSPACNTSGCHASMDLHALHKNSTLGCGLTDVNGSGCHNAANLDKLPTMKSCGGTGGANGPCHQGYASGTHGVSNGGKLCSQCHGSGSTERLDKMNSDTSSYHHVLDYSNAGNVWDVAPNTSTYPTDENAMACVSCHADHNYFNSNPGANLRTSINAAGSAVTNTDFITGGTAGSNYDDGICLSCHYAAKTKSTSGQKSTGAGMSASTPAISATNYDASAHDFAYSAQFTKNSSAFQANCSKCHDDETDGTKTFQNGTYKIATHFSADSRLLKPLGITLSGTSASSEENLCFSCHITAAASGTDAKTVASKDTYQATAMTAASEGIYAEFQKTYKHNVAGYSGLHKSDEYTAAPASADGASTTGWWGTSNASKHVECEDCHNPHEVQTRRADVSSTNIRAANTAVAVSGTNKGVWGVTITGSASGLWNPSGTLGTMVQPTYTKVASVTYEWQMCLKCHSVYAFGQNPPTVSYNLGMQTGGKQTDVGKDFSPTAYAYHPLFKAGKNQPATTANSVWDTNAGRRLISGTSTGWGFSNTLTDGWLSTSLVTCSDCHGSDSATAPSGVHGSTNKWVLKSADINTKVTIAAGTVTQPMISIGLTAAEAGNFCLNCHRRDVYGDGDSQGPTYQAFSRMSHNGDWNSSCAGVANTKQGVSGCQNCHGGRKDNSSYGNPANTVVQSGAVHGTVVTGQVTEQGQAAVYTANPLGYRFANGASWHSHQFDFNGTEALGCQTVQTDNYSSCNKHNTGTTKANPANYTYAP